MYTFIVLKRVIADGLRSADSHRAPAKQNNRRAGAQRKLLLAAPCSACPRTQTRVTGKLPIRNNIAGTYSNGII